ncbi:hypothetical protein [Yinghuangia soli]|uniref:Uncharacterized protein n=1 Tax=Yinghuangia soli TaxID=2908204 RepID=A0AA41U0P1_9ACTN|nr:hypothetical protein [Yinghuangia soli]MCF2528660.1 hypothetical protein [Yinghuangia soli]
MEPISLAVALGLMLAGYIVVIVITITWEVITEWFHARGRIKAENASAIAFTLADRIANQDYVRVGGVFDNSSAPTRMVQGFYDERTGEVLDARPMESARTPDQVVVERHEAGNGLVIYD